MGEPNWLVLLLLGTVAWPVAVGAGRVALLGYRRMRKNDLCGTWYEYNLSRRDGELTVVREVWEVSPSLMRELSFSAKGEGYEYSGSLTRERHHLLADYRGKGHEETVYCRLECPATTGARQMVGLWVGFDFDNNLVSGPQLLCRDDLSPEERRNRLLRMAEPLQEAPVLTLCLPKVRRDEQARAASEAPAPVAPAPVTPGQGGGGT